MARDDEKDQAPASTGNPIVDAIIAEWASNNAPQAEQRATGPAYGSQGEYGQRNDDGSVSVIDRGTGREIRRESWEQNQGGGYGAPSVSYGGRDEGGSYGTSNRDEGYSVGGSYGDPQDARSPLESWIEENILGPLASPAYADHQSNHLGASRGGSYARYDHGPEWTATAQARSADRDAAYQATATARDAQRTATAVARDQEHRALDAAYQATATAREAGRTATATAKDAAYRQQEAQRTATAEATQTAKEQAWAARQASRTPQPSATPSPQATPVPGAPAAPAQDVPQGLLGGLTQAVNRLIWGDGTPAAQAAAPEAPAPTPTASPIKSAEDVQQAVEKGVITIDQAIDALERAGRMDLLPTLQATVDRNDRPPSVRSRVDAAIAGTPNGPTQAQVQANEEPPRDVRSAQSPVPQYQPPAPARPQAARDVAPAAAPSAPAQRTYTQAEYDAAVAQARKEGPQQAAPQAPPTAPGQPVAPRNADGSPLRPPSGKHFESMDKAGKDDYINMLIDQVDRDAQGRPIFDANLEKLIKQEWGGAALQQIAGQGGEIRNSRGGIGYTPHGQAYDARTSNAQPLQFQDFDGVNSWRPPVSSYQKAVVAANRGQQPQRGSAGAGTIQNPTNGPVGGTNPLVDDPRGYGAAYGGGPAPDNRAALLDQRHGEQRPVPALAGQPGGPSQASVQANEQMPRRATADGAATRMGWRPPVDGATVRHGFRDPAYRQATGVDHDGMDYEVPVGTPVKAPVAGQVVFAGQDNSPGQNGGVGVKILGDDGRYYSMWHLSQAGARVGDRVAMGDAVGASGQTGKAVYPHVHFQVQDTDNRSYLDPNQMGAGASVPANVKVSAMRTPDQAAQLAAGTRLGDRVGPIGPAVEAYRPLAEQTFGDVPGGVDAVLAIMQQESRGNPRAFNPGTAAVPERSRGLMQINEDAWPNLYARFDMNDPLQNLQAARQVYDAQGWRAWFIAARNAGLI